MSEELVAQKQGITAIVPSTIDQVDAFAKRLVEGNYPLPAWIKATKSPEATASTIILRGLSLGMEPFTALEAFYEIKGRMGLYASAMAARVLSSGKCGAWNVSVEKGPDDKNPVIAIVKGCRKGMAPFEVRYSWADAVQQGYTASNQKYRSDPKGMLSARAIAIACRNNFPDVLRGMNYAKEELEDFKDAEVVKADPPPVGEAKQERVVRKKKVDTAATPQEAPASQEAPTVDAEFTPPAVEGAPSDGDDDLNGMFQ